MAKILLDHGADPGLRSDEFDGILSDENATPLEEAIIYENHGMVELLLEKGLQVKTMKEAEFLLMLAVEEDSGQVVLRVLEEWTIDADRTKSILSDDFYGTVREDVIRALLKNDADLNCNSGHYGHTPLCTAVDSRKLVTLQYLLDYGHGPNCADVDGRTALSRAAARGRKPGIHLLLKYHADIDMTDQCNRAPLFFAVMGGHVTVVKTLLDHGSAAAYILTSAKRSALSIARDLGWRNMALVLAGQGQDIAQEAWTQDPYASKQVEYVPPCPMPARTLAKMRDRPPQAEDVTFRCRVCDVDIPDSDYHFHCPSCSNQWLKYNICFECFSSGLNCPDELHIVQKRTIRDKTPVVLR